MKLRPAIKNKLNKAANIAFAVLAVSLFLSFFAELDWRLDLLCHFHIQYTFGALILGSWFCTQKAWPQLSICAIILAISTFQVFGSYNYIPASAPSDNTFKIVQYNRKYTLIEHMPLIEFIKNEAPDVIVIQEATQSHSAAAEQLKESYPYQIHEPRTNAFGMVVLSRHPFLNEETKNFERIYFDNIRIHITVQPDGFSPISIYALHPPPPMGEKAQAQRNMELAKTSEAIANDATENIIMLGDWNITPYSPYFKDILQATGLKNEYTRLYPFTTWPMHFMLPLFQIPIDHILHKGNLRLVEKERGPALSSDHYPVIATFSQ